MKIVDKIKEEVPHEKNHANDITLFFKQNELLADAITRRDYFEHLDDNDFLALLQQTANLIRTGDSSQYQSFDGNKVSLMFHEVPDQREKEHLLAKTWQTAQDILSDRKLSDQDALDYAGLTVAGGILLVHPFADGNGRTSRVLSHVMMRGTNYSDELTSIIANSSNSGGWSVAPDKKIRFSKTFSGEQPDSIEWEFYLAGEGVDAFGGMITDSTYKNDIIRGFIENADEQTMQLVRQAIKPQVEGGTEKTLDADKLLQILASSEGAGDYAKQLFALLRSERSLAVQAFLEGMRNGDLAFGAEKLTRLAESKGNELRERRAARTRHEIGKRILDDGKMVIRDQHLIEHRIYSNVYDTLSDDNSSTAS